MFMFFVTSLGARYMPEICTNQHQSETPVVERVNYTSPSTGFSVQALNDVVCPYLGPVFKSGIDLQGVSYGQALQKVYEKSL